MPFVVEKIMDLLFMMVNQDGLLYGVMEIFLLAVIIIHVPFNLVDMIMYLKIMKLIMVSNIIILQK